jgi:hypothetical protein
MGLFDIFKKKITGPAMKDLVWMSKPHKLLGAVKLYEEHKDVVLIAWFNNTEVEFTKLFQSKSMPPQIKMANQVSAVSVLDKTVIFLERYPLRSKEESRIADWKPKEIFVLNSIDDPLFRQFGGERIQHLMRQMGAQEHEMLENSMISKALENAQRKLDKKVVSESLANSADEWFRKNISHES